MEHLISNHVFYGHIRLLWKCDPMGAVMFNVSVAQWEECITMTGSGGRALILYRSCSFDPSLTSQLQHVLFLVKERRLFHRGCDFTPAFTVLPWFRSPTTTELLITKNPIPIRPHYMYAGVSNVALSDLRIPHMHFLCNPCNSSVKKASIIILI